MKDRLAVIGPTKLSVDTSDKLIDSPSQILILLDVLSRRHGDLYELDLADPFRMSFEEVLEGMQLLWHAFDVVESVDTDDELDAFEFLLQLLDPFLHLRSFQAFGKLFRVDTNRKGANGDDLAGKLDGVRGSHQATIFEFNVLNRRVW